MKYLATPVALFLCLVTLSAPAAAPDDQKGERSLPSRYPYVVQDALKYCKPAKGFWVDLGAGKGPVAFALIEAAGNPIVMVDPNREAMAEGLKLAREKGLADRLFAVVGKAEQLPFLDNSVDLVVSRGSIFFWTDPAQGLREVYRVLRPGGKAYIGGGAGSGFPKASVEKLIQGRVKNLQGEQAEKGKRFVEIRRPEQMQKWANDAKLPKFTVMGKGAISADDPRVGQGVWLVFEKEVGRQEQSPGGSDAAGSGTASTVLDGETAANPGRLQVLTTATLASAIEVMKKMFEPQKKVEVQVQQGRPEEMISLAGKTGAGDVLALVSDALMDQAELSGAIRPGTRTLVGSTHTVLLVPKANPKGIRGLSDLGRPGIRVVVSTRACLAGAWEDVMIKAGLDTAEAANKNVVLRVPGCGFLVQALLEGKADVGLGWPYVAMLHPDKVRWVSLPPELEIRRGVCMAVTKGAKNPELAARFIAHAKSRFGQAALAWWEGRAPSPGAAQPKKPETTTK